MGKYGDLWDVLGKYDELYILYAPCIEYLPTKLGHI